MSHIVIWDDVDGVAKFRQFDDLGNAVTYLEEHQNVAAVSNAKLFELNEVPFEVKSYVKIEIVEGAAGVEPVELSESEAVSAPVTIAPDEVTPAAELSSVEDVMLEPIEASAREAFAPADPAAMFAPPPADAPLGTDLRRGLFGR